MTQLCLRYMKVLSVFIWRCNQFSSSWENKYNFPLPEFKVVEQRSATKLKHTFVNDGFYSLQGICRHRSIGNEEKIVTIEYTQALHNQRNYFSDNLCSLFRNACYKRLHQRTLARLVGLGPHVYDPTVIRRWSGVPFWLIRDPHRQQ